MIKTLEIFSKNDEVTFQRSVSAEGHINDLTESNILQKGILTIMIIDQYPQFVNRGWRS